MALKDIWQQDRETRQVELKARQQAVTELRSQHQSEHQVMATQLRAELNAVLPKLRADEIDRQLEAQCAQIDREIEVESRRQEVQAFLYELHQNRSGAAADLRLLLEEFRRDRQAQSVAITLMLQEARRNREAEVNALFEQFALEKLDRQAAVQAIRDYVWGDSSNSRPIPVTAEAIEGLLELAIQESALVSEAQILSKPKGTQAETQVKNQVKIQAKSAETPIVSQKSSPLGKDQSKLIVEIPLTERLLATVNQSSGVRLSDLEATLNVSRSELVQALQQFIRSGHIVQRDRAYYAKTPTPTSV